MSSFLYPCLCSNGTYLAYHPSYLTCKGPFQIIFCVFGVLFGIFAFGLHYLMATVFIDDYWLSDLPWAGEGEDAHIFHELITVIITIYLAINVDTKYSSVAIIIVSIIMLMLIEMNNKKGIFCMRGECVRYHIIRQFL